MPDASPAALPDDARLADLQRKTFDYFLHEAHPETGLVKDNTRADAPASIAATGLALACFPVGVARGFVGRAEAARRVLATLRFFYGSDQSGGRDATGHRGFYFHFLTMDTGRRAWKCELSTIDTALLLAGVLLAGQFFDADDAPEAEIRTLADALYRRCEWDWALNLDGAAGDAAALSHGWTPERGFLRHRWDGYSEALILYALALGSPTHAVPAGSYAAWTAGHRWKRLYGIEHVYAGPLFIHQLSHAWLDLRGIADAYMRDRSAETGAPLDYFENSRRATHVQRAYAMANPRGLRGYSADLWGVTASDGPGDATHAVDGCRRRVWGYRARGVPFGPDDGTLSPWAAVASLPFAPEIVRPSVAAFRRAYAGRAGRYGLPCAVNPSVPGGTEGGWVSADHYGLDVGPAVLMIENHRSGLPWRLMRACAPVAAGLRRAGFTGGWLGEKVQRLESSKVQRLNSSSSEPLNL